MTSSSRCTEANVPPIPPMGLENNEFREAAHNLIDMIIAYYGSLQCGERLPLPDVKPGFMKEKVPENPPEEEEKWQDVFKDIEKVVLDGNTHWQAPGFLGYFSTGASFPSFLGDMLSAAVSAIGFTWASSPSCTELETIMMDWLAKALGLPQCFIHDGQGPGGGVIQVSASDATLVTLLSARSKVIKEEITRNGNQTEHEITSRMVAYTSKYSHCSVERAGLVAMVHMRFLDVDGDISLRGEVLQKAIDEDRKIGKIPVYVCATLGTTSCLSFDNLVELGSVCNQESIWLHVDAAYAGNALLCPEFRHFAQGLEKVTSFNFNPHKGMQVSFDCSALWVRNGSDMMNSFDVNPLYLQHEEQNKTIDYRHWQIALGRRFRSIKLWFVLRMIGLERLRHHVRVGVARAKYFETLVRSDKRFQVLFTVSLGLVCFRFLPPHANTTEAINDANRKILQLVQSDRQYLITPSTVNGTFFLRVSTGSNLCTNEVLEKCWESIQEKADILLKSH